MPLRCREFAILSFVATAAAKVTCNDLSHAYDAASCCSTPDAGASIHTGEAATDRFSVTFRAVFESRAKLLQGQQLLRRQDLLPTTALAPGNRRLHLTANTFGDTHFIDLAEEWESFDHYAAYLAWRACTGPLPNVDGVPFQHAAFASCEPTCNGDMQPCAGSTPSPAGSALGEYLSYATAETATFTTAFVGGVLQGNTSSVTYRF